MSDISRKIFDLTFALFRVADRFPTRAFEKKELGRRLAYRLLKKVISFEIGGEFIDDAGFKEIKILIMVLVAEFRRLKSGAVVNPLNFEVLEREYLRFLNDFVIIGQRKIESGRGQSDFRRRRILDHLQESGLATIHDLAALFHGASSPKTIQRDLNSLLASQSIVRLGSRRWSRYAVNSDRS